VTKDSEPTLDELRDDSKAVIAAIHPIIPQAGELDQLLSAVDAITPAPCPEDGFWRLTPSFQGAGVEDPEAFIVEAEDVLASLGLPSDPSRRNGVVGRTAYVSAKDDGGRLIAVEAGEERTLVQYTTVCSSDQSLRDSVDEAREEALSGGAPDPATLKKSRWGIRG